MVFEDVNVVVCNALPFLTAPFHAELRHPFAIQLRVDRSAVEVGDCIESIDTGRCDFADTRGSRTRGLDWPQRVFAWRGLGRSSAVALGRIGVVGGQNISVAAGDRAVQFARQELTRGLHRSFVGLGEREASKTTGR